MSKKNILTPVDFSVNSVHAFDFALQYSRKHNSKLHIIHIIEPAPKGRFNDDFIMEERIRGASEELEKFVNEIPHEGVEILPYLKVGNPGDEILSYSQKNNISMIIISSHGWTSDFSLANGSVAQAIINRSKIPVICLRAGKSITNKYYKYPAVTEYYTG